MWISLFASLGSEIQPQHMCAQALDMLHTMVVSSEVVMDILLMTRCLDTCLALLDRTFADSKIAYLAAVCLHDFAARGVQARRGSLRFRCADCA